MMRAFSVENNLQTPPFSMRVKRRKKPTNFAQLSIENVARRGVDAEVAEANVLSRIATSFERIKLSGSSMQ